MLPSPCLAGEPPQGVSGVGELEVLQPPALQAGRGSVPEEAVAVKTCPRGCFKKPAQTIIRPHSFFFAVMSNSVAFGETPIGTCHRFKVRNDKKVPCTVNFVLSAADKASPEGSKRAPSSESDKPRKGNAEGKVCGILVSDFDTQIYMQ